MGIEEYDATYAAARSREISEQLKANAAERERLEGLLKQYAPGKSRTPAKRTRKSDEG